MDKFVEYDSPTTARAGFETSVTPPDVEWTLAEDWDAKRFLLNAAVWDYREFRDKLISKFSAPATWDALSDISKQALVRHYVWKSSETVPNLDLLYTQAERDQFMEDTVALLNDSECNFQKVMSDGTYWNVLPDTNGNVAVYKLETDVPTDTTIPTGASFVEMYMVNNSTDTVIATIYISVKVAGATTLGYASADFTHANNKLTYTGTKTKKFRINVTTTTIRATGSGDKLARFAIFLTGVKQTKTHSGIRDIGLPRETTLQGILEMATDDYIEIFIENRTDDEDFTIQNMVVIAVEIKE